MFRLNVFSLKAQARLKSEPAGISVSPHHTLFAVGRKAFRRSSTSFPNPHPGGPLSPTTEERSQAQEPRIHPFLLAQSWRLITGFLVIKALRRIVCGRSVSAAGGMWCRWTRSTRCRPPERRCPG